MSMTEYLNSGLIIFHIFGHKLEISDAFSKRILEYLKNYEFIRIFEPKTDTLYFINKELISIITRNPFVIFAHGGREILKLDIDENEIKYIINSI